MQKTKIKVHDRDFLSQREIAEIDQHLSEHDNDERLQAARSPLQGKEDADSQRQLKAFNFCAIVQKAKPILKVVRRLLFWKPNWQLVLDEVISAADDFCPDAN